MKTSFFIDEAYYNIKLYRWSRKVSQCVSFSVIQKRMTLNDLDWLFRNFRVKFCFRAGFAGSDRATFEK